MVQGASLRQKLHYKEWALLHCSYWEIAFSSYLNSNNEQSEKETRLTSADHYQLLTLLSAPEDMIEDYELEKIFCKWLFYIVRIMKCEPKPSVS